MLSNKIYYLWCTYPKNEQMYFKKMKKYSSYYSKLLEIISSVISMNYNQERVNTRFSLWSIAIEVHSNFTK